MNWIRSDQRQRWQNGYRVPIEAYLELAPLADADRELILDLVYSEFILCQEIGEAPSTEDFVRRFPMLDESLRRLLAVDHALLKDASSAAFVVQSGDATVDTVTADQRGVGHTPARQSRAGLATLPAIGKYPILGALAEGGQGVVYRALHPTLGKEVVIKLSKQPVEEAGARDQLLAEGQLLARIDHPNLVRVFDLDFYEGRPFLVMELVAAVNLEQYRDRAHPSPRQAAEVVARVARALDTVHRQGIIHRDIKPKNILIDDKDQPKLIDFGLARWQHGFAERDADAGVISGTLAYIAPEQARAEDVNIGPRSDVFGLGGVLFYLLTGRAPYREREVQALLKMATVGEWDRALLEQTPAPSRLKAICARALSTNPQERYPSALELARDLEFFVNRPRKVAAVSAILVAGLLACALIGWLIFHQPYGSNNSKGKPIDAVQEAPLRPSKLLIDVVRKPNGPSFALDDVLPVITDNELRFSVDLPARRHASLFHFSEGKWALLEQWPVDKAPRTVTFPGEAGARVPLQGKPGTEFFLFTARKANPILLTDLQTWLGDVPAFPNMKDEGAFFTFNEREVKQWRRGVVGKQTKGSNPEDIAYHQLARIRDAVRTQSDVYAGVLFVHKASDD